MRLRLSDPRGGSEVEVVAPAGVVDVGALRGAIAARHRYSPGALHLKLCPDAVCGPPVDLRDDRATLPSAGVCDGARIQVSGDREWEPRTGDRVSLSDGVVTCTPYGDTVVTELAPAGGVAMTRDAGHVWRVTLPDGGTPAPDHRPFAVPAFALVPATACPRGSAPAAARVLGASAYWVVPRVPGASAYTARAATVAPATLTDGGGGAAEIDESELEFAGRIDPVDPYRPDPHAISIRTRSCTFPRSCTFHEWNGSHVRPDSQRPEPFPEVYHGRWQGAEVAIRVLPLRGASTVAAAELFRELDALARLRHPRVEALLGVCRRLLPAPGRGGGCAAVVARAGDAVPLFDRLRAAPAGTPALRRAERARVARDVADAMRFLHSAQGGTLGRDAWRVVPPRLRSPNVVVLPDGSAQLRDVGLTGCGSTPDAGSCGTGDDDCAAGGAEWASPEACRGEKLRLSADAYSYGVILWELASGRVPWERLCSGGVRRRAAPQEVVAMVGWNGLRLNIELGWALSGAMRRCFLHAPQRPNFVELHALAQAELEAATLDACGAAPRGLLCPLTLAPVTDPVAAADGHSYERAALEAWLRGSGAAPRSPVTGALLERAAFRADESLRRRAAEWRAGRGS